MNKRLGQASHWLNTHRLRVGIASVLAIAIVASVSIFAAEDNPCPDGFVPQSWLASNDSLLAGTAVAAESKNVPASIKKAQSNLAKAVKNLQEAKKSGNKKRIEQAQKRVATAKKKLKVARNAQKKQIGTITCIELDTSDEAAKEADTPNQETVPTVQPTPTPVPVEVPGLHAVPAEPDDQPEAAEPEADAPDTSGNTDESQPEPEPAPTPEEAPADDNPDDTPSDGEQNENSDEADIGNVEGIGDDSQDVATTGGSGSGSSLSGGSGSADSSLGAELPGISPSPSANVAASRGAIPAWQQWLLVLVVIGGIGALAYFGLKYYRENQA